MNAADLVARFGVNYGITGLCLNDQGQARIGVDGQFDIELEWSEGEQTLHIFAVLGLIAAHDRASVMERALSANLFGRGTGGAGIAFDETTSELVLCDRLRGDDPGVESLRAQLESFINATQSLRATLFSAPGEPTPVAASPRDFEFMMRA
jgi:Tir chaperone protein (CesT) family